jgi:hypothetical protein
MTRRAGRVQELWRVAGVIIPKESTSIRWRRNRPHQYRGEVVVLDAEEEIGAHGAVFLFLQGVHDAAEHRHPAQGLEAGVVGAQYPWNAI